MTPWLQIVWDASPIFVEIGPLSIRWYGLLFALGFIVGFYIVRYMYRREGQPLEDLDALLLYIIGGTVIGARLGMLFYYPDHYLSNPTDIIRIWEGGVASHGGVIGVLIALYLYVRSRPDQPYLWVLDRLAVPAALCAAFIRIGNVFNSEILGVPADVPWAFVFELVDNVPRHPVQLYEATAYLIIFATLFAIYRRYGARLSTGALSGLFFVLVFTARFFAEFYKETFAPFEEELLFSMGQLLSLPAVLLGLGLLLYARSQSAPHRADESAS